MRCLFALRLFSGFEDSLASGRWAPSGAPTIYRLIEALHASHHEADVVVFAHRDANSYAPRSDTLVHPQGLAQPIQVIAGDTAFPRLPGGLGWYLGEVRKAWRLWQILRRTRPDVLYMDRGNIVLAGLMARLCRIPVVMRMMGIPPATIAEIKGRGPFRRLVQWAYRAPFALVVCTQDGSGGEMWLPRIFAPGVPTEMLLNGVVPPEPSGPLPEVLAGVPAESVVALFVGRLISYKGAGQFLDAVIAASAQAPNLHGILVGSGPQEEALREKARAAAAPVTFTGRLPHSAVAHALARADIYVSLNEMANLSNANLEAMKAGLCIVVPPSRPDEGVDVALDAMFPPDSLLRLERSHATNALADALVHLHNDPQERRRRAGRTREIAERVIPTWGDRIAAEIALLESVAATARHHKAGRPS